MTYTTTVDVSGNWSVDPDSDTPTSGTFPILVDGDTIDVKAIDPVGNNDIGTITISVGAPAITITAPTKLDNASITDTTISVTDPDGVLASAVVVDLASTATTSSLSCTQTSSTQVDCTITIDSSGDLVITATDDLGDTASETEAGYIIDSIPPTTLAAPDLTTPTDTGMSSTDDITSQIFPSFTGVCTTGDTIELYIDGIATGDTDVCSG